MQKYKQVQNMKITKKKINEMKSRQIRKFNLSIQIQKEMEELNELKNLVMQNLQKNGYLSNIRAQIRSSVFKTIDSQQSSTKKVSPFYSENVKVQKLGESKEGQQALQLIQQVISFYKMDNSLTIFNSESNSKTEAKRDDLAKKNNVETKKDEAVLYTIFSKFMEKNKAAAPVQKQKKVEKAAEMPMQMKQDESEGEVEEEIVRNESRKFGESEEFGQSQGYDITVDSLKLEEYDYYEEIQ